MSKYQTYPEYKDSNSKWLGEIPSHWQRVLFKRVVNEIKDGTHGTHQRVDDGCVFLSAKNVFNDGIRIGESESRITNKDFEEIVSNGFPKKGDLLITCVGTIGRSCVYTFDEPIAFQRSVAFLRLNSLGSPSFYKYYVESKSYQEQLEAYSKSSAQSGVYMGDIISTAVVLVPMREQTKIAAFLNHETAKIDTLIDKQQQLIELLKEKRQAVISHAVTKGLNPDAPMKDSGVEWLGEVPEHWDITKLKYYSSIQGGYAFSSTSFTEEGIQILRIGNVYQNRLALERQPTFVNKNLLQELPEFKVQRNDILMSLTGTLGKRDYGFAVKIEHDNIFLLNQRVAKLQPFTEKIDSDFLIYILWSESYLTQLYSLPSGTKQANLANSDVLGVTIAVPPSKEEQKKIAEYLNQKLKSFDVTIEKANSAINLMQERRTALISAAVTGKIDVRHWVAPTTTSDTNEALQEVTA